MTPVTIKMPVDLDDEALADSIRSGDEVLITARVEAVETTFDGHLTYVCRPIPDTCVLTRATDGQTVVLL